MVVGVSGGADSVCLLRTLAHLNFDRMQNLIVAHYDHRCRSDSSKDADFVLELAESLKLVCERGCSDRSGNNRSEAELRGERYQFLESVASSKGARYVAVAHTCDDHVETIIHNILRGTGGNGLRGIAPFRPLKRDLVLARPMLGVARSTVEFALSSWNQLYRDDPSNQTTVYTRNWLRNQLLPQVRTQFPEVDAALLRLSTNVSDLQDAVDVWAHRLDREWVTYSKDAVTIQIRLDDALPSAVAVRLLQCIWENQQWPRGEMRHNHWQRVAALLCDSTTAPPEACFHVPGKSSSTRISCRRK